MTTLSPPPLRENILQFAEPDPPSSRWRRLIPRSRRSKSVTAAGLAVLLVAGVLSATYETSPGGTLWGVEKTIFPGHSQDVALTAVVNDLKQAQDILGSGQQPTPDQLTSARTSLNQAKEDLDYLSSSPERTSLQNLYLQLTQELLQYTPDSVQQLPALPAPPPADPAADPSQSPDVALTTASAPSWGYPITDEAGTVAPDDYGPPPPGVPDAPLADWPQPYAPPLTPNLEDLGYYDPSWGPLYGYNPGNWYNYDLSGYNQYGYDFLGFDRWGYDRCGYDRWGYDRWGYNWAGYNWAGYDRNGWDHDGRNDWGQRRDHPGDPRDQDWYNGHHSYEQYYQWKFQNNDPVYRRTQWDQARGFNPNQYQNWNMNRDWHNPRNRDWAPLPNASVIEANIHVSSPVVNLNASLAQFISNGTAAHSGPSIKDLADKSTRDFTKELAPQITIPTGLQPVSPATQRLMASSPGHQTSLAPPALTASAPTAPPSKVSPAFTAPKLSPVPAYTPPKADQPQGKSESVPADTQPGSDPRPSSGRMENPSRADSPNPAAAPSAEPRPATPLVPAVVPAPEDSAPHQVNPVPQAPQSESRDRSAAPVQQEPPQQRTAPESHPQEEAPAPKIETPAPKTEAPAPEAPARQAPVLQAPAARAPEQPDRQAPPAHEAPPARQEPPPASRPAPEQHAAPAPAGPKCSIPAMC
ncbi:hypothetical protein [Mycolicibacterium sphagni]|uniref:DUF5667 domain-containing protein n=1 Tax=Mycolicibacterium sphagni TaxID=1786 RepID=A0ABX2JRM2_9MYCO|nr:hypothetical protein [Mycolicibacterium sphagni]NTY60353.1 hypothetical protein [Mycolicibacterium sphagni]